MKKIFMIFAMCVLGTSTHSFGEYNEIEHQCYNNTKEQSFFPTSSNINAFGGDDDWFCYGISYEKISCFLADSDACIKNTVVCALGTYTKPTTNWTLTHNGYQTTRSGALIGKRICATAYSGSGSDQWYDKDNFQQPQTFTDCTDIKWKKNDSISKTTEVMVINGEAYISVNGYPMQYWINYNVEAPTKYPNICVGYYCAGANGKYTEPCDDGTCAADCKKTSDNNSDGGNSGGDSSGGNFENDPFNNDVSGGAGKDKKDVIHRHTVAPWLKALDAYMSSCKK